MKTSVHHGMRPLCIALSFLLTFCTPAGAQDPPTQLNLVVVEGEGAINRIGQRASRDAIVRVEDQNNKQIANATVVFTLPTEGASGAFANGDKTLVVMTDTRGLAAARSIKVNQVPGELQIHITASYQGLTARTNLMQFDLATPGAKTRSGSTGKIVAILAVAGAAAAAGAVATQRKGTAPGPAGSPPAVPISITAGTGTIGPPR